MGKMLLTCLIALLGFAVAAQAQNAGWQTYRNERFGTRIEYPRAIFSPLPPPANGDGLKFKARDGAEFTISASHNVLSYTAASLERSLHRAEPGDADLYANVSFRLSRPNLLVLSGLRTGMVYYEKFLLSDDGGIIHHFAIAYPATAKGIYDPIVERMSKSMGYAR